MVCLSPGVRFVAREKGRLDGAEAGRQQVGDGVFDGIGFVTLLAMEGAGYYLPIPFLVDFQRQFFSACGTCQDIHDFFSHFAFL